MNEEVKHVLQHAAMHAGKEVAKGAGCMVTLFTLLTGTGVFSAVIIFLLFK